MRETWKRLWARRPRLSRGQKTVRNFLLCVPILIHFWGLWGYPLPTAEMEFRRMERTHLIPCGEIVFASDKASKDLLYTSRGDRSVYALDGTELHLRDRWFVDLREGYAAAARVGAGDWDRDIQTVPLEAEGPTLLPLSVGGYYGSGYWVTEKHSAGVMYTYHNFFSLLLVNVPDQTVQAEITVEQGNSSVTGPGWDMGGGVWLLTPDSTVLPYQGNEEQTYSLRLYQADGSLLLEKNGTLPEE